MAENEWSYRFREKFTASRRWIARNRFVPMKTEIHLSVSKVRCSGNRNRWGQWWWGIVIFQRNERTDQRYCFSLHENRTAVPVGCILPIDLFFFFYFLFFFLRGGGRTFRYTFPFNHRDTKWINTVGWSSKNLEISRSTIECLILLAVILKWWNWFLILNFWLLDFFLNLV